MEMDRGVGFGWPWPRISKGHGQGSVWSRVGAVCVTVLVWAAATAEAETVQAVMEMEVQALDLDSGTVSEAILPDSLEPAGADLRFAYNADRTPHVVAVSSLHEGVELAVLDDIPYDAVSAADVAGLSFSASPPDLPLEPHDTVVVRTDTGAVFKIGNAVESGPSVSFNYERLE